MESGSERRRFNKTERLAAWLAQNGKSIVSGEPLNPNNFHADHRMPWSKGGATEVENCDAMTPEENLSKGAKIETSRFAWQDEFVAAWMQHVDTNFFLCVLPGGGKTHASGRVAEMWIEQGGIIVVVSPTRAVRRHWRTYFQKRGRFLDESFYGFVKEGYCGVTTTYAALHGQSSAFRKLCADNPVLLICDEIHHASEDENSHWGQDLREAFKLARKRLLLSGTPVRSDKETTSFLEIESFVDEDGRTAYRYKAHFTFDWPRALEDKTIRSITFHRLSMDSVDVEYATKNRKSFSNNEDEFLSYALDHTPYIFSFLREGNDKLTELRRSDPSAAGVAFCKDIGHAKKCYALLQSMGEQPVLVTSDEEEDSTTLIDQFRDDHSKRWLVSVRQVWEGVDIPRARVGLYLTNYATELAFRQGVGRVVRRREEEDDTQAQAHVFIPETPKLTAMAATIERLQELALKRQRTPLPPPPKGEKGHVVDGAETEFIGYIIHGRHFVGDRISVIRQLMDKYKISEESASMMLDDPEFASGLKTGETPRDHQSADAETPPWVQEAALKAEILDHVKQLIKIRRANRGYPETYDQKVWGVLAAEVHAEFMVGRKAQPKLSVSELRAKLEQLRNAIIREERT